MLEKIFEFDHIKERENFFFQFEVIFFCSQDICVLFISYFFITCLIYLIQ